MAKYTQGFYKVINKDKYKGNAKNIVYRSSWELSYLFKLDTDPNVIEFSSEEVIIPYRDINGTLRRYFVDFYVKRKVGDQIITELVEIKPYKETIPPVITESKRGKPTKSLLRAVTTWDINQRKWAAAELYCEKKGWTFRKVTERELRL
jgi:hypothetical protein